MKTENRLKNGIRRGRKQTAMLGAGLFLYMAGAVITAVRPADASTVHWQDAFIMQAQSALQNAPDSSFYLIDLDGDDILDVRILRVRIHSRNEPGPYRRRAAGLLRREMI